MNLETKELRKSVIKEIEERVNLGITEKATADFLKKILDRAENKTEILLIAQLGEMYKKTCFHYTQTLEKFTDTISYFSKNNFLSFSEREREPFNNWR